MLLNVLDFPTPQDAFDSATVGDRIYFPGIAPYVAPPGGWRVRQSVEVFGDGPGSPGSYEGTVLTPSSPDSPGYSGHVLVLEPSISFPPVLHVGPIYIHDLKITRRADVSGTDGGDAIRFVANVENRKLEEFSLERVDISYLGGAGVRLFGLNGGNSAAVGVYIRDCVIRSCGGPGISLTHATLGHISGCHLVGNGSEGLSAVTSEVACYACHFEGNAVAPEIAEEVVLLQCPLATVQSCRFSDFKATAIRAEECGGGAVIRSNVFNSTAAGSVALRMRGAYPTAGGPGVVFANRCEGVSVGLAMQAGLRYMLLHPQCAVNVATPYAIPNDADEAPVGIPTARVASGAATTGAMTPRIDAGIESVAGIPGSLVFVEGSLYAYVGNPPTWRLIEVEFP